MRMIFLILGGNLVALGALSLVMSMIAGAFWIALFGEATLGIGLTFCIFLRKPGQSYWSDPMDPNRKDVPLDVY